MSIPPRLASSPYIHVAPTHRQAVRSIGHATDAAGDHPDDIFTANNGQGAGHSLGNPSKTGPEELPAPKSVAEYRPSLIQEDRAFYAAIQLCKQYLEERSQGNGNRKASPLSSRISSRIPFVIFIQYLTLFVGYSTKRSHTCFRSKPTKNQMYTKGYLLHEGLRSQQTAYHGKGRLRDLVLKAT